MTPLLLIDFSTAEAAVHAGYRARDAGFPPCDLLSPHPVDGAKDILQPPLNRAPVGWVMVIAGIIGGGVGYGMQWFSAVVDYPILSGGRPLHSWPAFLLVPYETTILAAGVIGVLAWILMCGLPALYHIAFQAGIVQRASQDRYILALPFSADAARWAEGQFGALYVHEARE